MPHTNIQKTTNAVQKKHTKKISLDADVKLIIIRLK